MASLFGRKGKKEKFDASKHEDMRKFEAIPAADYVARITESDTKQTKKKDGHYTSLKFVIDEGKFKGRVLFTNLNLDNPSEEACRIAEEELATICRACGKSGIEDSEELHDIPMTISVALKAGRNGNPPENKITFYRKLKSLARPVNQDDEEDDEKEEKPKKKKPKVSFDD